ncbi:hypothetical protein AO501_08610 [Mycobacterium gordonae]|uniref:Alanine and proline rich membrane protein n=1 Tax=Mycobacterium gordonae TaxID=1778 RepID=A0A0Q2MC67_MYCGO|nr:hypothetical protein AO501_08610 [Mycobacterium gordonae]
MIAFVAIGIAIGAWFRPLPKSEPPRAPTYSSQEVADAKSKVCAAFDNVHQAVRNNFARDQGTDPNQQLVVALAGQQALTAGSLFLQTTLSRQPATPSDLAAQVQKLIDVFQGLAIDYLNGRGSPEVDSSLREGDAATLAIQGICK